MRHGGKVNSQIAYFEKSHGDFSAGNKEMKSIIHWSLTRSNIVKYLNCLHI